MNKKQIAVTLGALLVIFLVLLLASVGPRRYRADSIVFVKPYTNTLFARSFESHVIRTIPTVLSLRVVPTFSTVSGSGSQRLTNGVSVEIVTLGPTAAEAEKTANEAARNLCAIVFTNYGVAGEVVQLGYGTRKYSFFHDSLQPTIGRLLKP